MEHRGGRFWLIILIALLLTAGCRATTGLAGVFPRRAPGDGETLTVYAAASLTDSFPALADAFHERQPAVTVWFNFAGSQQLAQQLANGAPGDVLASADERQMNVAVDGGRVDPGSVRTFAANSLVVVVPQGNPANISRLEDLTTPGLRLVLATPEVPVGRYTRLFLEEASTPERLGAGYRDRVLANVSSLELSVRAVLTKVALGEADAGIVYSSDVTGSAGAQVETLPIPEPLNVTSNYLIAPVNDSEQAAYAREFIAFVRSPHGQSILREFGFLPVPDAETE